MTVTIKVARKHDDGQKKKQKIFENLRFKTLEHF